MMQNESLPDIIHTNPEVDDGDTLLRDIINCMRNHLPGEDREIERHESDAMCDEIQEILLAACNENDKSLGEMAMILRGLDLIMTTISTMVLIHARKHHVNEGKVMIMDLSELSRVFFN